MDGTATNGADKVAVGIPIEVGYTARNSLPYIFGSKHIARRGIGVAVPVVHRIDSRRGVHPLACDILFQNTVGSGIYVVRLVANAHALAIHATLRVDETVDIVVLEILAACVEAVVVNVDDIARVVVLVGVVLQRLTNPGGVVVETGETICESLVHSINFQKYITKTLFLARRAAWSVF